MISLKFLIAETQWFLSFLFLFLLKNKSNLCKQIFFSTFFFFGWSPFLLLKEWGLGPWLPLSHPLKTASKITSIRWDSFHELSWDNVIVTKDSTAWSVRIRSYSSLYFLAFGLNTERYSVSLHIQSECGKIRTRITLNTDTFYAL